MAKSYFLTFGGSSLVSGLAPTFLVFKNPDGTNVTPPSISEVSSSGIYTFAWGTTHYIAFLADAATTSPGAAGRYVVGSLDPADRIDEVGTSLIALGTSHIAQGVSLLAQGVSNLALGTSNFALGTSNFALGTTNVALGTSNVALGTSNLAIGTTLTGYGVSGFAQGSTLYGYAVSIYASSVSIYALGLTLGSLDARVGSTLSSFGDSSTDPGSLFGYMKRMQEFLEGDATFTKSSGAWAVKSRGGSLIASKTLSNSSSTVTKD